MNCFIDGCDGKVKIAIINYEVELKNTHVIIIPNLSVERCEKCNELYFHSAACKTIEQGIVKEYPDYFSEMRVNSKAWVDKTLESFNVKNEPQWDRCDNCSCPRLIF